jgi:hypothetical protein
MSELKRDWSSERLLALALSEGLSSSRARRCSCPARCSDVGDSCAITDSDSGALWSCHRCGAGGSVVDLLVAVRRIDVAGALAELEQLAHVIPARPPKEMIAPDANALWLSLTTSDAAGEEYLRGRGLSGAAGVRFNAGKSNSSWLNHRARDGYRIAMPLFGIDGKIVSMQLRSTVAGVVSKDAKRSLARCPYPPTGVALGDVGRARTAPRVYVTEGIADTLALQLVGLPTLGAPGVDQLKRLVAFVGDAKGREFVLCPQNDGDKAKLSSASAFTQLAGKLRHLGGEILRLVTPAEHKDPAAWRQAIGADAFAGAALEASTWRLEEPVLSLVPALPREPGSDDDDETPVSFNGSAALAVSMLPADRPEVKISTEQRDVNDAAVKALAIDPSVYQRGGLLVHVVRDASGRDKLKIKRQPRAPQIVALPAAVLRERLAAAAQWKKWAKTEHAWMSAHPPDWSVAAIHARGTWEGVRALAGVVETPVLRPDGTVLDKPGYDVDTELVYEPGAAFPELEQNPTGQDALAALDCLLEVVADFPFSKPEHRSSWLAALLTPLARHAFAGPSPLFLFDANSRGAGKSKLTDIIALIVSGRPMARMTQAKDDEEQRKRITTVAMAGDPLILLDNVEGTLGSESLNAALTGTEWKDRLLGGNIQVTLPLLAVWFATGNNVVLAGDTTRRTLWCRLETPYEKPEERSKFLHPELEAWVAVERPRLVHAAVTLLRAYCAAGRPDMKLLGWGSFEGWSRLIRHCLVWAGQPDPGLTREELAETSDSERSLLEGLIAGWEELDPMRGGLTVREALNRLEGDSSKYSRLRNVLDELAPAKGGALPSPRSVANKLKHLRGRIIGGLALDKAAADDRDGFARWKVRSVQAITAEKAAREAVHVS